MDSRGLCQRGNGGSGPVDRDRRQTAPADLAAVAAELAGAFPLVLAQTSLVLLDVDPGHLHAFWTLAPGDLEQARTAFPAGGGQPQSVVCLRRLQRSGRGRGRHLHPPGGGRSGAMPASP